MRPRCLRSTDSLISREEELRSNHSRKNLNEAEHNRFSFLKAESHPLVSQCRFETWISGIGNIRSFHLTHGTEKVERSHKKLPTKKPDDRANRRSSDSPRMQKWLDVPDE